MSPNVLLLPSLVVIEPRAAGPAAPADVTPVLVTYNSASILPWSLPPLAECREVVVVDNGSTDDTLAVARRLLPHARLIRSGANLGFGRANNLGLETVTTPFALLHNPDARLDAAALHRLLEAAQRHPEAAILAPTLFDAPGRVGDFFRDRFDRPTVQPAPLPEGDLCAEFVTGAMMLLNMRLMREVGFFDPWFFLYCEDDDLCLRVRRAGHAIVVVAAARAEHHARQSTAASGRIVWRRAYFMTLSKLYLIRKYSGRLRCAASCARIAAASLLSLPLTLLSLRRDRVLRQAARATASLLAWRHLRSRHCAEGLR